MVIEDFLACLFNVHYLIFMSMVHEYAYNTYEYISKLSIVQTSQLRLIQFSCALRVVELVCTATFMLLPNLQITSSVHTSLQTIFPLYVKNVQQISKTTENYSSRHDININTFVFTMHPNKGVPTANYQFIITYIRCNECCHYLFYGYNNKVM